MTWLKVHDRLLNWIYLYIYLYTRTSTLLLNYENFSRSFSNAFANDNVPKYTYLIWIWKIANLKQKVPPVFNYTFIIIRRLLLSMNFILSSQPIYMYTYLNFIFFSLLWSTFYFYRLVTKCQKKIK